MADIKGLLKNLLVFSEPPKPKDKFVMKENKDDISNQNTKEEIKEKKDEGKGILNKIFGENEKKQKEQQDVSSDLSKKLSENLDYIKKRYTIPTNGDVIIREFEITTSDKSYEAFLVFFDGMVDRKLIDDNILSPLMFLARMENKTNDIFKAVKNNLLPQNQIKILNTFDQIVDEINFGSCGLFIEGLDRAFLADVKGWEHRSIDRPNTELVIRGPQEGFSEILRVNTALVRKILKDEDLIVENISIGRRSKTPCSVLYIKDLANNSLIEEVRRRINSLKVDYIIDSGELEQLIEDNTIMPAPQIIATERPDRAASMLIEGKVAVILHGSPFALVMPATNNDLMHSPEDSYVRFPYANLLRFIRILGIFMSLLLPGLYLAITTFHQEMIPTDLLLAIEASREKVPFPTVVEILIMELAFELIREAGIRIPGPIGPTLGIIGALILGQAAVAANIVSPILIIIVAVTGIGSFAIPNFSLAFAFRFLRFAYIFLGAVAGFLGITAGLFVHGLWLVNAKSFGVPFMAPFAPKTNGGLADQFLRTPIWMQEDRPDYLNTKDKKKQPQISRRWKETTKEKGSEDGK